ncbi:EAL domain-containing protein [Cellulomonas bogoriensis]|uniref:Diguanylate cyclase n=1 Tax=Cellulomonas bogoriensis 69B4 = DSM 16987 TaxID=1386082 RepID=A0A0A0BVV9_9CELL|nr:EAL domain-containing protein [Cellulomonas bogoriensis]KGM11802.1 diguanylate cyclase [Cellulomonas bogoriensis 69B4 = DSM 16987]
MQASFTVLALTHRVGGFYNGEVLQGLLRETSAAGGRLVVVQTVHPEDNALHLTLESFELPIAEELVDAVVSIAPAVTGPYLARIQARGVPVVLVSDHAAGVTAPVVTPDNAAGVRAGLEHLMAHGHTRIGFVADLSQHDFRERLEVYRAVMTERGLPAGSDLFFRADSYGEHGGARAARAMLARPNLPTAVMTATDRNALGLVRALRAGGARVPHDVAVVGFDDVPQAEFAIPSLSSVRQRFDVVGALAGRLVRDMVAGRPVASGLHRATASVVVPRGTCGCRTDLLNGEDPGVSTGRVPVSRRELRRMLHTLLDDRGRGSLDRATVDQVLTHVERVVDRTGPADHTAVAELVRSLQRVAPRVSTLHEVATALTQYLDRLLSAGTQEVRDPSTATALHAALWQVRSWGVVEQSNRREASVVEHGMTAGDLQRTPAATSRRMGWLGGTHVRAGLLGLWEDRDRREVLRVTGVHDTTGTIGTVAGAQIPVREFPGRDLIDAADHDEAEVCMVVPVRSRARHSGAMAVLGRITSEWDREPYHYWAQQLNQALESEELEEAARLSEERYTVAAQAANDGLWELDVTAGTMNLSTRCRDLLDLPHDTSVDLDGWMGAVHPQDRQRVRTALRSLTTRAGVPAIVEFRVSASDGTSRWLLCRGLGAADETSGEVERLAGSLSDIDQSKALEEQLRRASLFDAVTGLPNRPSFVERLGEALDRHRRRGARFAVLFLDVDGFKLVNDSLGHLMGDELLRVLAERLQTDARSQDVVARFGGDELAVLLQEPVPDDLEAVAARVQSLVAAPMVLAEHEVSVTASVGIATCDTGYTEPEDVLRDVDLAMNHAKDAERGTVAVFDPQMHARAADRLRSRAELRAALAERQFVVHYQPVVDLTGGPLRHLEALVRWEHPERGLLMPGQFLPAMEEDGTVATLGEWLTEEVVRQLAEWHGAGSCPVTVAVNLSHREFWSVGLVERVRRLLDTYDVPAEALVMEITEGVFMDEPEAARTVMQALRESGIRLHVDDFGTGQSSLNALRTFPVDALKIDGSFVRELGVVHQTTELLRIIVEMGAALGLDVVAEHVETENQAQALQLLGCAYAQGWLYGRAMPACDVTPLLGRRLAGTDAA